MKRVNLDIINRRAFAVRGLSDEEFARIKQLAKEELSFRVAMRMHKQKYAARCIDIRPYGKGVYRGSSEEFKEVLAFVERHNLVFNTARIQPKSWQTCYNDGFTYVGYLAK